MSRTLFTVVILRVSTPRYRVLHFKERDFYWCLLTSSVKWRLTVLCWYWLPVICTESCVNKSSTTTFLSVDTNWPLTPTVVHNSHSPSLLMFQTGFQTHSCFSVLYFLHFIPDFLWNTDLLVSPQCSRVVVEFRVLRGPAGHVLPSVPHSPALWMWRCGSSMSRSQHTQNILTSAMQQQRLRPVTQLWFEGPEDTLFRTTVTAEQPQHRDTVTTKKEESSGLSCKNVFHLRNHEVVTL